MNMIGDLHDHLMSTTVFTLIIKKGIYTSSNNHEGNGYGDDWDLLIISNRLHVAYPTKKWMQREKYPNNMCLDPCNILFKWFLCLDKLRT